MSNHLLYIGTYTRGSSKSEGLYTYKFSSADGSLTPLGVTRGIKDPSFLAVSSDKRFLYATSEVDEHDGRPGGAIVAYRIEPGTGTLTRLNHASTHGGYPCYVSVDKTGHCVFAASYVGGNLTVIPVREDGSLEPTSQVVLLKGSGPNEDRQEAAHAHSITLSPDNRFAYAADLGSDKVMIYRVDLETCKLVPAKQSFVSVDPGQGPRHFDFHPNGRFAYLINELGNTIVAYACDEESGALDPLQSVPTLPGSFTGESTCADIHVHPSGKFLYGSNRGHDSLVICSIDADTGQLKVTGHVSTGGRNPRNFAIDPTGTFLLAANSVTNDVTAFTIDQDNGNLTPSGQKSYVPKAVCIKFL